MKVLNTILTTLLFFILSLSLFAQDTQEQGGKLDYPKSLVSFSDFENLMGEVKNIRAKRLISFSELKAYQADPNTVLLDARSRDRFKSRHLKGAVNLPYTDFTEENLRKIIPDVNTRILIYCNNNFLGDEIDFAGKGMVLTSMDIKRLGSRTINAPGIPKRKLKKLQRKNRRKNKRIQKAQPKEIMLALNVPTYITLYGYGYRNIYELDELVNVRDAKVDFEGHKNGLTTVIRPNSPR